MKTLQELHKEIGDATSIESSTLIDPNIAREILVHAFILTELLETVMSNKDASNHIPNDLRKKIRQSLASARGK